MKNAFSSVFGTAMGVMAGIVGAVGGLGIMGLIIGVVIVVTLCCGPCFLLSGSGN